MDILYHSSGNVMYHSSDTFTQLKHGYLTYFSSRPDYSSVDNKT